MGVRLLETFMEKKVPGGLIRIDMRTEITNWKNEHNGEEPIIVVDVQSLKTTFQPDTEKIFGGRQQIMLKQCHAFLSKLKSYGVQLKFFVDGTVDYNNRSNYNKPLYRNIGLNKNYQNVIKMFDKIQSAATTKRLFSIPLIKKLPNISQALSHNFETYGECFTTYYNECDKEIASYATKHNVLAILAQESNFMIFNGNWQYWSTKYLKFDKCTTIAYNRLALCEYLKLSQEKLALVATFSGNDIIPYESVQHFHRTPDRFIEISEYIRSFQNMQINLTEEELNKIVFDLFHMESDTKNANIRKSIQSYDLTLKTLSNITALIKKLMSIFAMYGFYRGRSYTMNVGYFDYRRTDFTSYTNIMLPIIKRQIGIILQHKNNDTIMRNLWCKFSHREKYQKIDVYPEYPQEIVPHLLDLLDETNVSLTPKRFQLLFWSITGTNEQLIDIANIPDNYQSVCLSLYYLVKITNQISINEADVILYTIHQGNYGHIPDELPIPQKLNARNIMISHLFLNVQKYVLRSYSYVGLKKPPFTFDGVFFCKTMDYLLESPKQFEKSMFICIGHLRNTYT